MFSIQKWLALAIIFLITPFVGVKAQEDDNQLKFNVSADLVSSYVWRGMYQTGASIQPTLGLSIAGFSFTLWGSTDFDGNISSDGTASKEIDMTATYTLGNSGLTLSIADLWWPGQNSGKYFNFKSHETDHHFEAGLAYILPVEKFPLSLSWYTMFAGQDKNVTVNKGHQNYSSYVELNYPFNVKMVNLNVICGMVPYKAPQYNTNGFAVTNVSLKGSMDIKITNSFSVPIFAQAIWNPRMEDAHFVFGLTLRP